MIFDCVETIKCIQHFLMFASGYSLSKGRLKVGRGRAGGRMEDLFRLLGDDQHDEQW